MALKKSLVKMSSSKEEPFLNVTARAPFHIYFEGKAQIISAKNSVGNFDILPGHADFFSMLEPCTVRINTDDEVISFKINNGILIVQNLKVSLFANL